MPHVIVHFNPKQVDQTVIDKLKADLPNIVAHAFNLDIPEEMKRFRSVHPKQIFVGQWAAHPTDANPSSVEIKVEAEEVRWRDPAMVRQYIADIVRDLPLLPRELWDLPMEDRPYVWILFAQKASGDTIELHE